MQVERITSGVGWKFGIKNGSIEREALEEEFHSETFTNVVHKNDGLEQLQHDDV